MNINIYITDFLIPIGMYVIYSRIKYGPIKEPSALYLKLKRARATFVMILIIIYFTYRIMIILNVCNMKETVPIIWSM